MQKTVDGSESGGKYPEESKGLGHMKKVVVQPKVGQE